MHIQRMVPGDVYKTDIMETGIIIAACIVAYFLQLGMGAVLGSDQNKWLKIGFIIPGIGLLVQLIYLFYCMFYIMFDE